VELLHCSHFHHVSLVSGLAVCFPPQGAAVRATGVQPILWNWDYLLVPSFYIMYYISVFGCILPQSMISCDLWGVEDTSSFKFY
jgi:hypothetical protein